jgi:glucokinase
MVISVDIGGTKILAGRVSLEGIILERLKEEVNTNNLLEQINRIIQRLLTQAVKLIVIGFPGFVDKEGNVVSGPNIKIALPEKTPLKELIQARFKLPVKVLNDALLYTIGEWLFGKGKGKSNIIGLTLGTGIGGGVILDSKPLEAGGELGHQVIVAWGRKCGCGKSGCFESYCSIKQIKEDYKRRTKKDLDIFEIERRLIEENDMHARQVFEKASRYLAYGLSNLIHIFHPEVIVIGGSGAKLKFLLNQAKKELEKLLMYKEYKTTKIENSQLQETAPLLAGLFFL